VRAEAWKLRCSSELPSTASSVRGVGPVIEVSLGPATDPDVGWLGVTQRSRPNIRCRMPRSDPEVTPEHPMSDNEE
jgi:hypothetical protein